MTQESHSWAYIWTELLDVSKIYIPPCIIAALFKISKTWMDKDNVIHIYNGILLSNEKEQNNAICRNMDAIRESHIK